jgi:hypothetical protein
MIVINIGFRDLITKDFEYFGHRFRSRGGCGDVEKEWSPIFIQFLGMYCTVLYCSVVYCSVV